MADITYVPTRARFLYLAIGLDAWSRRVIGWATHLRSELVIEALEMAVERRRPEGGVIDRSTFRSPRQARLAIFDYIERFYNPHRRHSALDYESPVNYERRWLAPV